MQNAECILRNKKDPMQKRSNGHLHRVFFYKIMHSAFIILHFLYSGNQPEYKKTTRGEGWSFHPIAARGAGISRKRQSQSGTVLPDSYIVAYTPFFDNLS